MQIHQMISLPICLDKNLSFEVKANPFIIYNAQRTLFQRAQQITICNVYTDIFRWSRMKTLTTEAIAGVFTLYAGFLWLIKCVQ